jgi:hypothetical protein
MLGIEYSPCYDCDKTKCSFCELTRYKGLQQKDEQIIKGLECIGREVIKCAECPYNEYCRYPTCHEVAGRDALDLIKRQKAEIESLNNQERILIYHIAVEREKAIKDFAERLLKEGWENVVKYTPEGCDLYFKNGTLCGYSAMKEVIDNLVKEMTGGQE